MKKKVLSLLLSFTMVFSTTGLVFAENDTDIPQTEPTKVEKEKEQDSSKEETKKEEVKEEPQKEETQKEEVQTEETQVEEEVTQKEVEKEPIKKEVKKRGSTKDDVVETQKVTVQFQVIKSTGNWANAGGSSSVVIKKGETGSKTFTIKDEDKRDVTINGTSTIYHYLKTWGDGKYSAPEGKIKLDRATVFNEYKKDGEAEVTVYIKADYQILKNYYLNVNYIDNVANGGGGASHYSNKTDYTHTFKTPADIPSNYEFLYWENKETGDTYKDGETFTVKANTLDEDTTVNIYAVYNYQPQIKAIYHYKVNHSNKIKDIGIYTEPINIYEMSPVTEVWFYEDSEVPIEPGTEIELPEKITKITNPVEKDKQVIITHIYAHYYTVTWINDNNIVLEEDLDVSYGTMPSYDGETPTKERTAQYTYTFAGWTPEPVEVKENATYTATYDKTINTYTVTWVDYNNKILEEDLEVPYGDMPSYDGATPKRSATSKYKYKFTGWTPEISEVTGDVTYQATYKEIPIPVPPKPDPTPDPDPNPNPDNDTPETINNTTTNTVIAEDTEINWILGENAGMGDYEEDVDYTPISTGKTPLFAPKETGSWALINLLAALATIIIGFVLIVMYIINKAREEDEDEDESEKKEYKNRGFRRIISVIVGIISVIIFFLTENTNLPMEWVDKWTILMIIILIINIIIAFLSRRVEKEEEEEE